MVVTVHPLSKMACLSVIICLVIGCMSDENTEQTLKKDNVVEIRAVGTTFEGPTEIPSGWTTFRFVNASHMLHFAIVDAPPDSVTIAMISAQMMQPFQDAMDGMIAGDEAAVNEAFGRFPEWIGSVGRLGGPGFLSPGLTGETTVFLEPGRYVMECYVKSNGVFHTTSPGDGQIGMLLEFTVTDIPNEASEPAADVTIAIRNSGYALVSGAPKPGTNVVRVNYEEQQALPSFVGNDIHLIKVNGSETIPSTSAWFDWRSPQGLESPGPATFLGGVNDMSVGSHAYFTVDLEPGSYAFIAEHPDPLETGFVLPFEI